MKQIFITEDNSGQRLDKLLSRFMRNAPKSFLYKMLRKKNIVLNGKKAQGNELLHPGDQIKLFISDETWEKFGGISSAFSEHPQTDSGHYTEHFEQRIQCMTPSRHCVEESADLCGSQPQPHHMAPISIVEGSKVPVLVPGVHPPNIIYQDEHLILFNKPSGMLSQKAGADDVSVMEYLEAYLLSAGYLNEEQMRLVRPSICNRLDRNTSGLLAAGISLAGLQTLNRLFKERSVRKFYHCIVCGAMTGEGHLYGFLTKNTRTNTVKISANTAEGAKPIETAYRVLSSAHDLSLLEVHLITGRSHQIRAHLASIGHPILGDPKYGDPALNKAFLRSHGVRSQLLHAYRMEFPQVEGRLSYLSGKQFTAPEPEIFGRVFMHID
ncbi:MAG: RluA family pseudouridine synthase [Lachnospiraceae bacterium]|nr:RluA family pseudouridine synthase [Lachnospiraceae bacterium]